MHIQLSAEFWLQTAVYVIGGFFAVVAVAYRIGQIESTFVTKHEVKEKMDKVYNHVRDCKQVFDDTLMRKDVCNQMFSQAKEDMKRIDDDAKNFRHDTRNALQRLDCKMDDLKESTSEKFTELKEFIVGLKIKHE